MIAILVIAAVVVAGAGVAAVRVVKGTQERTKWGINLSPPTACPRCGESLPAMRVPSSVREALWGGWTCKRCRLALDKWGRPRGGVE